MTSGTEPSHDPRSQDIRQREIAREQAHVDRVYARLGELRAEAERVHREGFQLAAARVPGSLVERDAMVFHAARRLRELDAEYEGLVFGRLDLVGPGDGENDGEVRHIGRLGVRDAEHEPLLIDWRAPGAAPFYQATPEEPLGVGRRRVIRCAGPKVVDLDDDLLDVTMFTQAAGDDDTVVGDGALMASLVRARGTHMRDIVATIQREQDQAIRAPAGGVTLIEGGPGTGKTAVALHRAAHLLYRDRRRFEGGGVLLIGPSPVFMSYVDRVLPSLGEETVEPRSLGAVLDGVESDRLDPPYLAALKGSLRMRRFLQRGLREAPAGAPSDFKMVYGGQVLRLGPKELSRLRRDVHGRGRRSNQARPEVRRLLVEALWRARPEQVRWNLQRFADEVADRDEFAEFIAAWWPVLSPVDVLGSLADPRAAERAGAGQYTVDECRALAASWKLPLSVADVALADELRVMLGEPERPRRARRDDDGDTIRELTTVAEREYALRERAPRPDNYDGYAHVLVDEAQDLSPMQWRMLGRRGQYASWTIVGDAAQSAWPDLPEAIRARDEALKGKQIRRFHLTTNYRNSAEIFEYAAEVVRAAVPDADLPVAVRRTGILPVARTVGDLAEAVRDAVAELYDLVEGTIGVIAAASRRDQVASWLASSDARVQVLTGMQAKGMEYDGVVVVAPDELRAESAAGVRVLYVALTRATHRLITLTPARA